MQSPAASHSGGSVRAHALFTEEPSIYDSGLRGRIIPTSRGHWANSPERKSTRVFFQRHLRISSGRSVFIVAREHRTSPIIWPASSSYERKSKRAREITTRRDPLSQRRSQSVSARLARRIRSQLRLASSSHRETLLWATAPWPSNRHSKESETGGITFDTRSDTCPNARPCCTRTNIRADSIWHYRFWPLAKFAIRRACSTPSCNRAALFWTNSPRALNSRPARRRARHRWRHYSPSPANAVQPTCWPPVRPTNPYP